MEIYFTKGRRGDCISRLNGKVVLIHDRDPRREQVRPGETWEVRQIKETPRCIIVALKQSPDEIRAEKEAQYQASLEKARKEAADYVAQFAEEIQDQPDYQTVLWLVKSGSSIESIRQRIEDILCKKRLAAKIAQLWVDREKAPDPGDMPDPLPEYPEMPYTHLILKKMTYDGWYSYEAPAIPSMQKWREEAFPRLKAWVRANYDRYNIPVPGRVWLKLAQLYGAVRNALNPYITDQECRDTHWIHQWCLNHLLKQVTNEHQKQVTEWKRQQTLYLLTRTVEEGGKVELMDGQPTWVVRGSGEEPSERIVAYRVVDPDVMSTETWTDILDGLFRQKPSTVNLT